MSDILMFDPKTDQVVGPAGSLPVAASDQQARRFLMLLEGECLENNITAVAQRYGFSRPRYYQLLERYKAGGLLALELQKTGPKSNYRRSDQTVRQVLRYRFLDPDASAEVITQKLRQTHFPISLRSVHRIIADYGVQKKLYALNPKNSPPPLPTQRAGKRIRLELADARSVEREVRQLLADKVSGNLLGLWLLMPEHLRLGTWDLLRAWSGESPENALDARLALHLVHEAALCRPTLRNDRSLRHTGFELANGLAWLPTDGAVHDLLEAHTIEQAQHLQCGLGKLRRASGHFPGQVLALDAHRLVSYSKREMIQRRPRANEAATKQAQTFFLLDTKTRQPICLVNASSARHLTSATQELLELTEQILPRPQPGQRPLLVADVEHFTVELLDYVREDTIFDLLEGVTSFDE
jgi:transposase